MSATTITEERNIANALISGLANLTETPTREQVEEKAKQIAAIFGYTGDLRNIITEEIQKALNNQMTMQQALDTATDRSNQLLKRFADTYPGATLP